MKKDVFCLVTSMGQRKNSEFPWGIEPLTFGFHTVMLYHWAGIGVNQTLRLSESESLRFDCCDITMVIWWLSDACSDALPLSWNWSTESEGLRFISSWGLRIFSLSKARDKTKKHLSPFLHGAQNLPSLLFFLQAEWYLPFDWFLLMIYWKQMHRWSHNREIFFLYHITQIDSMLPWICSAVDHGRQ